MKVEDIEKKLKEVMKKDIVRVQNLDKGWQKKTVRLGKCVGKVQGLERIQVILDTIEDFGIDLEQLDAIEPNYDDLYQIYKAINTYRNSIRYLRELKRKMNSSNSGWANN